MTDKIFADGLHYEPPPEKAPEYIKGKISIHVQRLTEWLEGHVNERGYVNITVKQSQKGSYYCELDTWKPKPKDDDNQIPF